MADANSSPQLPEPPHHLSSPYGYIPSRSVAIVFVVLFAISTLLHSVQSIWWRKWWLLPTICLAGAIEVLGWGGRLWSSNDVMAPEPFEMQICATILGPTPLVAANFIILGRIIKRLGPRYSRLSPKLYAAIFLTCDIVALVVQGVGGGMAAVAVQRDMDPAKGGNIMLGGIVFQMVTITVYVLCAAEFYIRYMSDKPVRSTSNASSDTEVVRGAFDKRLKLMSLALSLSTVCLLIRAIYRTIELAGGWRGRVIMTEIYFNVLDGAMVIIAIYALNFAHPGLLLRSTSKKSTHMELSDVHHSPALA
ncbi:hypothetical protein HGRIS_006223 [Hohenbuehelia grisea]|uniref:RTA1-domain-containing protein n=1 Tax=Hohenbuehelia grisea TaxID=104357 RepID=A0ABR3K0V8_9AGAR